MRVKFTEQNFPNELLNDTEKKKRKSWDNIIVNIMAVESLMELKIVCNNIWKLNIQTKVRIIINKKAPEN